MSSEAITKNDLKNVINSLLPIFYPVGSYYETSDATFNPNTEWGGTWELELAGQVHVSSGTGYAVSGAETNTSDGGAKTVTLTASQIPAHNHGMAHTHSHNHVASGYIAARAATGTGRAIPCGRTNADASGTFTSDTDATTSSKSTTDNNTDGGGAHNNMPPYIVVNRWHRTA